MCLQCGTAAFFHALPRRVPNVFRERVVHFARGLHDGTPAVPRIEAVKVFAIMRRSFLVAGRIERVTGANQKRNVVSADTDGK